MEEPLQVTPLLPYRPKVQLPHGSSFVQTWLPPVQFGPPAPSKNFPHAAHWSGARPAEAPVQPVVVMAVLAAASPSASSRRRCCVRCGQSAASAAGAAASVTAASSSSSTLTRRAWRSVRATRKAFTIESSSSSSSLSAVGGRAVGSRGRLVGKTTVLPPLEYSCQCPAGEVRDALKMFRRCRRSWSHVLLSGGDRSWPRRKATAPARCAAAGTFPRRCRSAAA
jgi:hypothetical protein